MAITSTIHKVIERIKNASGNYETVYRKTLGELVEFKDGKTAESKVGGIDGIANNLVSTNSRLALSASQGKNLQDQVNSHLAESAKKHITESGSNEHGSYVKFDDGTLEAYGRVTKAAGAGGYVSFTCPVPIVDKTKASVVASGANYNYRDVLFTAYAPLSGPNTLLECYAHRGTTPVTGEVSFSWQLKGRWKE